MFKKVCGMDAYIENDMIKYFVINNKNCSAYKKYKYGGYVNILPMKISTFRSGWYSDRYFVK